MLSVSVRLCLYANRSNQISFANILSVYVGCFPILFSLYFDFCQAQRPTLADVPMEHVSAMLLDAIFPQRKFIQPLRGLLFLRGCLATLEAGRMHWGYYDTITPHPQLSGLSECNGPNSVLLHHFLRPPIGGCKTPLAMHYQAQPTDIIRDLVRAGSRAQRKT